MRDIRHKVKPKLVGQYAAIDVYSGCWTTGESPTEARGKLEEMRPEAVDVFIQ